jgi:osmotically-inducible protein OsmY
MAAMVNSGYAALSFIGCEVDQNRVILRGCVPSYHLKQLAQVCAQRVEGISRVDNRLEVRGRRPC